jgi:predicted dithiol-disulfide oxidoreductase (DUF899 family)
MTTLHDKKFPGESKTYRTHRNKLLLKEIKLRKQIEDVAALRRTLPHGGAVKEDYVFEEMSSQGKIKKVKMSALFRPGKQSLIIYSMMYAPKDEEACPSCTSIVDGFDGVSPHVNDRLNFVVIAKAPIQKLTRWAKKRGWRNVRLLSSYRNTYNVDYFAQETDDDQQPALNVFQKTPEGIYHGYNTELLYVPSEAGQDGRHVDLIWPVWNLFDYTPEGRGTDWGPKNSYK